MLTNPPQESVLRRHVVRAQAQRACRRTTNDVFRLE
jgi:hypothetical protein